MYNIIPHNVNTRLSCDIIPCAAPPVNSAGEPPEVEVASPSPVVVEASVSFGRSIVEVPTTNSVAPGPRDHVVPSITVVLPGNKVPPFGKMTPVVPETTTVDRVNGVLPKSMTAALDEESRIVLVPTTSWVAEGARDHAVPSMNVVLPGSKVSPFGKTIPTVPDTVTLDRVKEDPPRSIKGGGVGAGDAGAGSWTVDVPVGPRMTILLPEGSRDTVVDESITIVEPGRRVVLPGKTTPP